MSETIVHCGHIIRKSKKFPSLWKVEGRESMHYNSVGLAKRSIDDEYGILYEEVLLIEDERRAAKKTSPCQT